MNIAETYTTPLGGTFSDTDIEIDHAFVGNAYVNRISPGYFETLVREYFPAGTSMRVTRVDRPPSPSSRSRSPTPI